MVAVAAKMTLKTLNERRNWNENPLKNEEKSKNEMELELTLE
jgi:hypothetical protein